MPFACGLTLEKLSANTVDEEGHEAFVKDNPLSLLRKVNSGKLLPFCLFSPNKSLKNSVELHRLNAGFTAEALCSLL